MDQNGRRRRRRLASVIQALTQPPPDATDHVRTLSLLLDVSRRPPDPILDIRDRLFAADDPNFRGRDVFSLIAVQRYDFFEMTGETPETFIGLIALLDITTDREHNLSTRNRVLLSLIWLRLYPCYSSLAALFNVSLTTITEEIRFVLNVLDKRLRHLIRWPSLDEWRGYRYTWSKVPIAVGAIDGTSHQIYRPQTEPQQEYYSGYRHFHAIHTQVVVDCEGNIRHVECGFLGHNNDAQQFRLMTQIGDELEFPDDCYLLGDLIYPNVHPVITPYTAAQLRQRNGAMRRKCSKLNEHIRKYRICVEHAIAKLKCYKSVSSVWRHPRNMLSKTVHVCATLVCRKQSIGLTV